MTGRLPPIISKLTCEEHRVRIFKRLKILQRANNGQLQWDCDPLRPKANPWPDHKNRLLTHDENCRIIDPQFREGDKRRIAAKTHRHMTADGTPGASGKYDPKTITIPTGIRYIPLPYAMSTCEICEAGRMIFPWNRHYNSPYRPSLKRCLRAWIRVIIRR